MFENFPYQLALPDSVRWHVGLLVVIVCLLVVGRLVASWLVIGWLGVDLSAVACLSVVVFS